MGYGTLNWRLEIAMTSRMPGIYLYMTCYARGARERDYCAAEL